jgi:CRP-like cAMP-binding protein
MARATPNFIRNGLLTTLSNADLALLQPHLEPVSLEVRQVLEAPNKPIKHCYFIERGLASIVALNGHRRLEVGLIGPEGMTGLAIVLGNDSSPMRTLSRWLERACGFLPKSCGRQCSKGARLRGSFSALLIPS